MMTSEFVQARPPVRGSPQRLLVPVDASERSRWVIDYLLRRKRAGTAPEAVLLYVAEPITDWQPLRFRTHEELARFQAQHGEAILDALGAELRAAGVSCEQHFREGRLPRAIVDAADLLSCDAILMPAERSWLMRLFERDLAHELNRLGASIPMIRVDEGGAAVDGC